MTLRQLEAELGKRGAQMFARCGVGCPDDRISIVMRSSAGVVAAVGETLDAAIEGAFTQLDEKLIEAFAAEERRLPVEECCS